MVYELLIPFGFQWIYRKVHALIQRRVGPPLLQPIYDFVKLAKKEVVLPEKNKLFFFLAPVFLFIVNGLSVMFAYRRPENFVLMLLVIFAVDIFLKAFLSNSFMGPFTVQGALRLGSMKMALDPAFPLSILAPAFIFGFSGNWPIAAAVFFPVAFVASMAELELTPFDLPSAKTEIAGGWKTELSGVLLAMTKYAETAKEVAISFLLASFFGGEMLFLKALLVFITMAGISASLSRFSFQKAVKYLTAINVVSMVEVIASLILLSFL
jgi:NADH-quinone oxidoreductase subunit H